MKSWYSTKLLFESCIEDQPDDDALCEESIRVFMSDNEESARLKAEEIGRHAEHEYANEAGETVRWVFVGVLEVQDLCEEKLLDGTEVFSTLFRKGMRSGSAVGNSAPEPER